MSVRCGKLPRVDPRAAEKKAEACREEAREWRATQIETHAGKVLTVTEARTRGDALMPALARAGYGPRGVIDAPASISRTNQEVDDAVGTTAPTR